MNFATHTLPQYVIDYFGKPFTMTRHHRDEYTFKGTLATVTLDATSALHARELIRSYVQQRTKTADGRVTRHQQHPLSVASRRTARSIVSLRCDLEKLKTEAENADCSRPGPELIALVNGALEILEQTTIHLTRKGDKL